VSRFHTNQCDDLIVIKNRNKSGDPKHVRDLSDLRQRRFVQSRSGSASQGNQTGAEADLPGLVSQYQPVIFERAKNAVGTRTVHPQRLCEFGNGHRCPSFGKHLERAKAAVEGL
jgi:hypothetical protein